MSKANKSTLIILTLLALAIAIIIAISITRDNHTPITPLQTRTIAAGGIFSMALTPSSTLYTWGDTLTRSMVSDHTPRPILEDIVSISAGQAHGVAITTTGQLMAWGHNHSRIVTRPRRIKSNVVYASAGHQHTAAILQCGTLYTWGQNNHGQLGNGTTLRSNQPVTVLEHVVAVSAGTRHTMAITTGGQLWGWGYNATGELGDGTALPCHTPTLIMDNVVAVSAGNDFTLAISTLWAWGNNAHGQLGLGNTQHIHMPTLVMHDVVAIAAGSRQAFAIRSDGTLWQWGRFYRYNLGQDASAPYYTSTPFQVLDNVATISAGDGSALAVKNCGTLYTWGGNFHGQLGRNLLNGGTNTPTPIKTRVHFPPYNWVKDTPLSPLIAHPQYFDLPALTLAFTGHPLVGQWLFRQSAGDIHMDRIYTFYPNGYGSVIHQPVTMLPRDFSWEIVGDQLITTNIGVFGRDVTYTFILEGDNLTLTYQYFGRHRIYLSRIE